LAPSERDRRGARRWPWAIGLGLAFVVVVNAVFAYLAVHEADHVVDSYRTEPR
jgi:hypothetical protein